MATRLHNGVPSNSFKMLDPVSSVPPECFEGILEVVCAPSSEWTMGVSSPFSISVIRSAAIVVRSVVADLDNVLVLHTQGRWLGQFLGLGKGSRRWG